MKDMLKTIIEMDEKARKLNDKTQQEKNLAIAEIEETKQKIHDDYIQNAKIKVEREKQKDIKNAEENWKLVQSKHQKLSQDMDKKFNSCKDEWINTIVNNIIG